MELSFRFKVESEIKKMVKNYKSEIIRMEFQINSLNYKKREINYLINEDNVNKLQKINEANINESGILNEILKEDPSIKLLTEYLDEINSDIKKIKIELESKKSFYDRIKTHIYNTCDHLWISDHFENPALMSMVCCTYCNVCGMTRDDV